MCRLWSCVLTGFGVAHLATSGTSRLSPVCPPKCRTTDEESLHIVRARSFECCVMLSVLWCSTLGVGDKQIARRLLQETLMAENDVGKTAATSITMGRKR